MSHVDEVCAGVDEDAMAKTESPRSLAEVSYQGLVAVSRPPRPKTPGSDIGARLMPSRSSGVSHDVTETVRLSVDVGAAVPSSPGADRTPESTALASDEHSRASDLGTENGVEVRLEGAESEFQEHGTCQRYSETCQELDSAVPQAWVSPGISGARCSPALRSLQCADTPGAGKLDSARSNVACKGTPTSLEAIELNGCYAEVAKGCLGHTTAQWLAERLTEGEPPVVEELEACLTFSSYDQDGDGRLSVLELGTMLRDQGMQSLDYRSAQKALELTASPGAKGLRLEGFLRLLKFQKDNHMGYSDQELALLRDVFQAYDANKSGSLETLEISELLADMGRAPQSREEAEELKAAVASCRLARVPGPISFKEFLCLARKIDDAELVHE